MTDWEQVGKYTTYAIVALIAAYLLYRKSKKKG